jgi:ribosome-binding factor A
MAERMPKINELIRQHLGVIIAREIELPKGVIVTITKVTTSKDMHYASIYLSILPDTESYDTMKILVGAVKTLRALLASDIVLRYTPKLTFVIDEAERKASEIDRLLDSIK